MNTFKIITTIIMVIGLVLGVGCEKSTDPGPVPNPEPVPAPNPDPDPVNAVDSRLVGEWVFTGATVTGQSASLADVFDWEPGSVMAAFSIDGDGVYIYIEVDADIELTFYTEGTVVTSGNSFAIDAPDLSHSGTWTVSRGMATFITTIDSKNVTLTAETLSAPSAVAGQFR